MKKFLLAAAIAISFTSFAIKEFDGVSLPPIPDVEGRLINPVQSNITKDEFRRLVSADFANLQEMIKTLYGNDAQFDEAYTSLDLKIQTLLNYMDSEFIESIDDITIDDSGNVTINYKKSNVSRTKTSVGQAQAQGTSATLRGDYQGSMRRLYITKNASDIKEIPLGQARLWKTGTNKSVLHYIEPNGTSIGSEKTIDLPSADAQVTSANAGGLSGYTVRLWNKGGNSAGEFDTYLNLTQISDLTIDSSEQTPRIALSYKDVEGVEQTKYVPLSGGGLDPNLVSYLHGTIGDDGSFQPPNGRNTIRDWGELDAKWIGDLGLAASYSLVDANEGDGRIIPEIRGWRDDSSGSATILGEMFSSSQSTDYLGRFNSSPVYSQTGAMSDHIGDGLKIEQSILNVKADTSNGISVGSDGVRAKVGTGLKIDSGNIAINLQGQNGVSVNGNVISGAYQAGDGISINGDTISATGSGEETTLTVVTSVSYDTSTHKMTYHTKTISFVGSVSDGTDIEVFEAVAHPTNE